MTDFSQLDNPTLLEDMTLDRQIHRLKYQDYPNRNYMSEERIFRNWLANTN